METLFKQIELKCMPTSEFNIGFLKNQLHTKHPNRFKLY
jgi:hypothetical protein